jgi:hypothetical protein
MHCLHFVVLWSWQHCQHVEHNINVDRSCAWPQADAWRWGANSSALQSVLHAGCVLCVFCAVVHDRVVRSLGV